MLKVSIIDCFPFLSFPLPYLNDNNIYLFIYENTIQQFEILEEMSLLVW